MAELHFLFTDIEGSTRLWEREPAGMAAALRDHDALLREAVETHGGVVFKTVGDAVCAVFGAAAGAAGAAGAAAAGQRALAGREWPGVGPLRVRMAVHSGEAEERDGDWYGPTLNRVARTLAAGHGGQVLLTGRTREALGEQLPAGTRAVDLGERRLKDLREPERLWQLTLEEGPGSFPPLKTLDARGHNLPVHATPLVGREGDVEAIVAALGGGSTRLLTLTGPGGVGKTRLAQQAAAELVDRYADGVWLVELAPLEAATEVAPAILEAMQPGAVAQLDGEDPEAALLQRLKERETLLVLDNVEHLPAAAKLIAAVVAGAPGARVIATSRAPLRLRAEQEHPVEPLGAPSAEGGGRWAPGENAAVDLFVERARAINPGFAADEAGMAAIAGICRAVDGLPLAIELAAARSRMLSPVQLLARLGERLPLLTGGARDLPARQRTMRDAIAWSVDLLPPGERALFGRLAVFHGGASLEAIEAVAQGPESGDACADPLDGAAALAEQSLIRLVPGANGDRVTMLETIREYAGGILAADPGADGVRERHARWSLAFAEQGAAARGTAEDAAWLSRLADDQANLRAALGWLAPRDVAAAARLGAALGRFWRVRGIYREGRAALESLIAAAETADPGLAPGLQAALLDAAANIAECQRDDRAAEAWFGRVIELAEASGDAEHLTSGLMGLGRMAQTRGELARATELQERVLAVCRGAGDEQGMAYALANLGIVAATAGDAATAEARLEESVAILRRLGDVGGLAACVTSLGTLVFQQGNVDRAVMLWEEGLAAWEHIGDRGRIADTLANLGEAASIRGDLEGATATLRRAMAMREELGDLGTQANELAVLGMATASTQPDEAAGYLFRALEQARSTGELATEAMIIEGLASAAAAGQAGPLAARLLGAAAELRRQTGIPLVPLYREWRRRVATRSRELCGERGFREALAEGRRLGREAVAAEAADWWRRPGAGS